MEFEQADYAIDAFTFGGLLLAVGWGMLWRRGDAGPGPLLGSLVLAACWFAGALIVSADGENGPIWAGIIGDLGMAVCAYAHLEALELEGMDGTRLAAMLAACGFLVGMAASSKRLPESLSIPGIWLGMFGTVLFGAALAFSAGRRGIS